MFFIWLGHTRGNGGAPHFHFGKSVDFPKWLQNIDNVLRHKYVSLFVQSVRIPNKKIPQRGVFLFGWGTRTRTAIYRVRVCCSTIKLCPNAWLLYAYQSQFASTSLTLFTEIHSTTPTQQILHDFHIEYLVRNRLRPQ